MFNLKIFRAYQYALSATVVILLGIVQPVYAKLTIAISCKSMDINSLELLIIPCVKSAIQITTCQKIAQVAWNKFLIVWKGY
jgi:hypothetical protein